jgi:zinc and cadmium transporter
MTLLSWIILFSLVGGVLSVLAAAGFLLLSDAVRERIMPHMVSFATGALLGAAFLGLLPEALEGVEHHDAHLVTGAVLGGLLLFFLLEKLVIWRHCHEDHCEGHSHAHDPHEVSRRSAGMLIIIGDGLHNFVDGVLIGAAFLTDMSLGIVTALAVAAHEIPQELGDFVILLHSGYSRGRALALNMLSSLTTVLGALLAYVGLSPDSHMLPYVIAVAVASFIYIAVADLIPGLHRRTDIAGGVKQMLLIGVGIGVIALVGQLLHHH